MHTQRQCNGVGEHKNEMSPFLHIYSQNFCYCISLKARTCATYSSMDCIVWWALRIGDWLWDKPCRQASAAIIAANGNALYTPPPHPLPLLDMNSLAVINSNATPPSDISPTALHWGDALGVHAQASLRTCTLMTATATFLWCNISHS